MTAPLARHHHVRLSYSHRAPTKTPQRARAPGCRGGSAPAWHISPSRRAGLSALESHSHVSLDAWRHCAAVPGLLSRAGEGATFASLPRASCPVRRHAWEERVARRDPWYAEGMVHHILIRAKRLVPGMIPRPAISARHWTRTRPGGRRTAGGGGVGGGAARRPRGLVSTREVSRELLCRSLFARRAGGSLLETERTLRAYASKPRADRGAG